MPRDQIVRRRRIVRPRIESLRPGRDENKSPAGSAFGHTLGIPNASTDGRTFSKRISVGDIFAGVLPERSGPRTTHFKIQALTPTRLWVKVRASANTRGVWAWVMRDDFDLAVTTGLVRHVTKAPFEI